MRSHVILVSGSHHFAAPVMAALLAIAPADVLAATTCEPAPLVVTHALLWTPDGARENQEMVVSGGRVVAVGLSGRLERPGAARLIDAQGATLLPGLIDAHTHLFDLSGPVPEKVRKHPREEAFPVSARQLLRSGVTSARVHLFDLVDGPALMRDAASDCFAAPRLQIGGPGFIGGEPPDRGRQVWGAGDDGDIRGKIAEIRAAGARWVATHSLERFREGQFASIVREAHAAGLRVMAEGSSFRAVELALEHEADSLEYIDQSTSERYPAELIFAMRGRGDRLFVIPTPGNEERYAQWRRDPSILEDASATLFMPDDVADFVIKALHEKRRTPLSDEDRRSIAALRVMPQKFRQFREAGLNMGLGTDAGSTAQFHIHAIWRELAAWTRLGVSPDDALRAATNVNAALLREPDIGSLQPGARADFIIYDGDIRDGVFALDRVRAVAKGGVLFVDEGEWVEAPGW